MRPRTIEALGCLVPLPLIGVAVILFATKGVISELAWGFIVAGFFSFFFFSLLLYFVPARCQEPGCNGHMHREWEHYRWVGHIIYTCDLCGAQYRSWVSWNTD